MKKETWRPLPKSLTIKRSGIEGLGLFAKQNLEGDLILGISHVKDEKGLTGEEWIRTPLGGFFNHSNTPNCRVIKKEDHMLLSTIREIKEGEELTATYTLYNPE